MKKLEQKGIGGNLMRSIEAIYDEAKARVKVQQTCGGEFALERGLSMVHL